MPYPQPIPTTRKTNISENRSVRNTVKEKIKLKIDLCNNAGWLRIKNYSKTVILQIMRKSQVMRSGDP